MLEYPDTVGLHVDVFGVQVDYEFLRWSFTFLTMCLYLKNVVHAQQLFSPMDFMRTAQFNLEIWTDFRSSGNIITVVVARLWKFVWIRKANGCQMFIKTLMVRI
jgi:hypothetical protein